MGDLKSNKLIVLKGILFLCLVAGVVMLILLEHPSLRLAGLLAVLIWASARLYYFLFYVLEKYVDPTLRYAGLLDLLKAIMGRRRNRK